jgi:hypothetical protein
MTATVTSKYQTICTVGYTGSVSRDENRAAHGGVCHIQLRHGANGIRARKVNSNGRFEEIGPSFVPTAEQVSHWEAIAKASR